MCAGGSPPSHAGQGERHTKGGSILASSCRQKEGQILSSGTLLVLVNASALLQSLEGLDLSVQARASAQLMTRC